MATFNEKVIDPGSNNNLRTLADFAAGTNTRSSGFDQKLN